MKPRNFSRILAVVSFAGLVAILGALLPAAAPVSAASGTPQVAVYLKNYHDEYDLAVAEFLAAQFDNPDSPAYNLVGYAVITTLTPQTLAGKTALVIDESADMSLTAGEAAAIHTFVSNGGRVGLFAFPRYYWDHEAANPAAYQAIADIWGITAVGEPDAAERSSGKSAAVIPEPEDNTIGLTGPYTLPAGQTTSTFDQLPFSPVTAGSARSVLVSPALSRAPVAVANEHGMFVTNSIGDAVQGGDANTAYSQFVTDAIVWLANASLSYRTYLPMIRR